MKESICPCIRFLPLKFLVLCNTFPSQILRSFISPTSSTVVQSLLISSQESKYHFQHSLLALSQQHPLQEHLPQHTGSNPQLELDPVLKATPVYPSSHTSKMLINHTAFLSAYASTSSLTHILKGLEACQDDHFHLILFQKVNLLMTFHYQIMKSVQLQALHHWAGHYSRNCPHRSYQRLRDFLPLGLPRKIQGLLFLFPYRVSFKITIYSILK